MGKLPEGYVTVKERVAKFCTDNGEKGSITTEVTVYPDSASAMTKATISIDGKVRATGHSMCDLSEDKGLEKGESVAIGRALEFAGYVSVDADAGDEPATEKKASRFERPTANNSSQAASGASRFSRPTAKAAPAEEKAEEASGEEETSEEQTETQSAPQEETKAASAPAAKAGGSRIAELSARYGVKNNAGTAQIRR